jgi:MerR family transcriptional regulator, thiopeptide resistance regulator
LRQLGFPLSQVAEVLAEPEWQLAPAIERHLAEARHRAAMASRLCARLGAMAAGPAQQENPSPQELFSTVEEMITMGGTVHGTTGLLMYDDVDAAHDYIVRVFGLASGQVWKSHDGFTEYGEVRAGQQVSGLHPAGGKSCRSPRSVDAVTGTTVISVDDADAHYARTVAAGAPSSANPSTGRTGSANTGRATPRDRSGGSSPRWANRGPR